MSSPRRLRRPVAFGAIVVFGAAVATWFLAQAILSQLSAYSAELMAITGLIAIARDGSRRHGRRKRPRSPGCGTASSNAKTVDN